MLDEPAGADALPHFLIGGRQENHVALEGNTGALQHQERHQLGDALPLHVLRPASPDVAVLDQPAEGVHRPVLRRGEHDVHVIEEDDGTGAAVAAQPRVQVRLAGRGLEHLRSDAVAGQHRREPVRRAALVPWRIGGIDAQVLREQLGRFVAHRAPLVVPARHHEQRGPLRELQHRGGGRSGERWGRRAMRAGADGEGEGAAHDEPVMNHGTDSGFLRTGAAKLSSAGSGG